MALRRSSRLFGLLTAGETSFQGAAPCGAAHAAADSPPARGATAGCAVPDTGCTNLGELFRPGWSGNRSVGIPGSTPLARRFSSPSLAAGRTSKAEEASRLLESITAFNLRQRLTELSEERLHLSYQEFVDLAKSCGAGLTAEDVEEVCWAFVRSGVVFRYKDVVYLKPDEVSEMVLQRLPHRETQLEKELEALRMNFAPLAQAKADIEKEAQTRSARYLYSGLLFMVSQFGAFYWLTYHELSWDVMEPIAYFFSLGYGIAAYLYFLINHEDFGFPALQQRLEKDHKSNMEKVRKFDQSKYERLRRDISRYERYLARYH